jgi:hypothetical protein
MRDAPMSSYQYESISDTNVQSFRTPTSESQNGPMERVTVCFESHGAATEVVVTHERIPGDAARASHERGWIGCLDSLLKYAEQPGN